jgi:tetratricopeptide (TPR) repeat protein
MIARKALANRLIGAALGAALVAVALPAAAQAPEPKAPPSATPKAGPETGPLAPPSAKQIPGPPAKIPEATRRDQNRGIDFLLGALKVAPTADAARHVEGRIWSLWSRTNSDTATLLMTRAKTASDAKNADLAIKLLDAVIKLKPDYVEGWNRRATLYYTQNKYAEALSDIREVLTREPRHFAALAGLGMIMQELGDDSRALVAYRQALAINPHLERVPERVKTLTEKVEGRGI